MSTYFFINKFLEIQSTMIITVSVIDSDTLTESQEQQSRLSNNKLINSK